MENEIVESKEIIEPVMSEPVANDKKENTPERRPDVNVVFPKKSIVGAVLHKIIFTVFAVVLFASVWTICDEIKDYGLDIALIRSVGGKTLEEAYYADIGKIYMYLADFIKVLTAGISGIILCITYK